MSSSIWKSLVSALVLFALFYPLIGWKADGIVERDATAEVTVPTMGPDATATVKVPTPSPTYEPMTVPTEPPAAKKVISKSGPKRTDNHQLLFPVAGFGLDAVISVYGDPRSGGKRSHEGVDIKAPRGTPVVAVLDGTVVRVKDGGGGGKQVWLETDNGLTFFYAHLDSWSVEEDEEVVQGEELGTVGNTGNASHTLPHLHFGIYTGRRSTTDPMPYLDPA